VLNGQKSAMTNPNTGLLDQLKKASEGLLFISESEAPIEPFLWESSENATLDTQTILQKAGQSLDTPISVVELDNFFQNATTYQEWHSPQERERVAKFQTLAETLKQNLNEIKVYRIGHRTIDVCIVGQTTAGDYAGLFTKTIET
jgi:hypothetical protein